MPDPLVPNALWGKGVTDAEGRFRIAGLNPDSAYYVRSQLDPWDPSSTALRCYSRRVMPGAEGVEIHLTRGVYLEGRVSKQAGGKLFDGPVLVSARSQDPDAGTEGRTLTRLQPDGSFRLGPLPAGRYQIRAAPLRQPDLGGSEKIEVLAPDTGVELVLPSRGTVSGHLLGTGGKSYRFDWYDVDAPREGWDGLQRGRTNDEGTFLVPSLPPRAGTLYFWNDNDAHFALVVDAKPTDKQLNLRLRIGESITGEIDLPPAVAAGKPDEVVGRVHAVSLAHGFRRWSSVARDGRFIVPGLPKGRYELRFFPAVIPYKVKQQYERVEVDAGATGLVLPYPDARGR